MEGIQCLQSLLKQFEPETAGIHERLAACLEYQQEFAAIYSEKAAVSENIQDRIKRRNQILISFSNDLEIYFQKRAVRHHHKDFFSSADKDHRRGFIESLELKLAKFKATGQTNEILDLVENEGKEYRGVYLQPLLNRLTLAIKNYNKQVPSTYEAPFHYEEKHFSEQQREELLKKIQVKNVETAERMYSLYKSIQAMKVYGETLKVEHEKEGTTAVQLSEQLSRRVDAFLMENEVSLSENGTVSEEKFQDFDTDFRVHLHSQDDVMSKQRKTWLPIVGNILISLCSAGLALVAKLAYTKLKEGHASGFFTKTARMGLVDDIEESMKKFAVASCA